MMMCGYIQNLEILKKNTLSISLLIFYHNCKLVLSSFLKNYVIGDSVWNNCLYTAEVDFIINQSMSHLSHKYLYNVTAVK